MRVVLLVACAVFVACESGGGGGSVTPDTSPRIVESFTCRDVDPQSRPLGITPIFSRSADRRIYVWAQWKNVESTHTASAVWYDPGGSKDLESSKEFTSPTGEQIVWFYISPAGMTLGRWEVELWLDGVFHRSHCFLVEE